MNTTFEGSTRFYEGGTASHPVNEQMVNLIISAQEWVLSMDSQESSDEYNAYLARESQTNSTSDF